jgi:GNAT superfamily N-acetyltransferase
MPDASPPAFSIADVVFAEATPRQRTLSWELNGASWSSPMTLGEYVGREEVLSDTALSANGGTKYWVLHSKDDPEAVVSGCETTAKKVLITDASGSRLVDAYSVASVFTNPQYRGRGLAGHMLKKVQEVVDESTECGALYSDIGRHFYSGLGWPDFRSPQVTLKMEEGFEAPPVSGVSLLAESDVAALCERDIEALTQKFEDLAKEKDGKTHITFLPSFAQCSWHFARDAYVAKVMHKREVQNRGAVTPDGASWLYWDHDVREKKLKIQRIVMQGSDTPEKRAADVRALLVAALAEASDWGLPKVLVWSPGREVSAAATDIWRNGGEKLQVTFDERQDGSIPSLRWKSGKDIGEVVWEDNEYFSWC